MRRWAILVAVLAVRLTTGTAAQALLDGQLPPCVLVVRVVEGDFVRNVVGQEVEVRRAGGDVDRSRTGADGRARFEGLPPGALVQVVAIVAGERLTSEEFAVPAASGSRLLLTARAAAGAVQTRDARTVWFIARILGTVTILSFAAIVWRIRRRR